jgi:acyl-CoA hydrolase
VEPKPARESVAEITHWMGLTDANSAGNIHGGVIMKLADEAAALAAIKHSRLRVVTAGIDRMDFRVPIYIGELVTFRATVNGAWRTSMEVGVRVEAEPWDVASGAPVHVATAFLTFVAIDAEGKPREVPPLALQDTEDERRFHEATIRRKHRLARRAAITASRNSEVVASELADAEVVEGN